MSERERNGILAEINCLKECLEAIRSRDDFSLFERMTLKSLMISTAKSQSGVDWKIGWPDGSETAGRADSRPNAAQTIQDKIARRIDDLLYLTATVQISM
jgi:hypothetical protein